jgi:hypothetical protein
MTNASILRNLERKIKILLNKIKPIRKKSLEHFNDFKYYERHWSMNSDKYELEYKIKYNKKKEKLNNLLIELNKLNSERKKYRTRIKVVQTKLFS